VVTRKSSEVAAAVVVEIGTEDEHVSRMKYLKQLCDVPERLSRVVLAPNSPVTDRNQ